MPNTVKKCSLTNSAIIVYSHINFINEWKEVKRRYV